MIRVPKKEATYPEVDITIPLDKSNMIMKETDCFGKAWDMTTRECAGCADRDICGILYKDVLTTKSKAIESDLGSKFLDEQDFAALTDESVKSLIDSGNTKVGDFIASCMELANTSDKEAIVGWIRRWIKSNEFVYTKSGIVWMRE